MSLRLCKYKWVSILTLKSLGLYQVVLVRPRTKWTWILQSHGWYILVLLRPHRTYCIEWRKGCCTWIKLAQYLIRIWLSQNMALRNSLRTKSIGSFQVMVWSQCILYLRSLGLRIFPLKSLELDDIHRRLSPLRLSPLVMTHPSYGHYIL